MLTWKLRISVLWIFLAVCQLAGLAVVMFAPGVIRGLMARGAVGLNTHSAGVQLIAALGALVPMAMAYLALALNDAAGCALAAFLPAAYFAGITISRHMVGMNLATALAFPISVALAASILHQFLAQWWRRPGSPSQQASEPPAPAESTSADSVP